jgi:hypothetical protein
MKRVEAEGRRLDASPPTRVYGQRPRGLDRLEDLWDSWAWDKPQSHRGLMGIPISLAKRAMLALFGPFSRELFRRQRSYNETVKDELTILWQEVQRLRDDVSRTRTPPSSLP